MIEVKLSGERILRRSISTVYKDTYYEIKVWCEAVRYDDGQETKRFRVEGACCAASVHNWAMSQYSLQQWLDPNKHPHIGLIEWNTIDETDGLLNVQPLF